MPISGFDETLLPIILLYDDKEIVIPPSIFDKTLLSLIILLFDDDVITIPSHEFDQI